MSPKCCVVNCANTRNDAVLYKFPTNEDRRRQWLHRLGLQPSKSKRFVCRKHFENRLVGPGGKLRNRAYPSLFTPSEISSGVSDYTENIDPLKQEHSYARKKKHVDHSYCKEGPSCGELVPSRPILSTIHVEQNKNDNELVPSRPILSSIHVEQNKNDNANMACFNEVQDLTASNISPTTVIAETLPRSCTPKAHIMEPIRKTICRKRIIHKFQELTPTAKRMYKEYKKAKAQNDFLSRAKRALKFSKNSSFDRLTKDMNPYAKQFLAMQMNLYKKKKKGRRFTLDEKLIALAIMKQGPRCYKFLHKIFILPSSSTLNLMVSKLNVEAGINPKLFELITKQVSNWSMKRKYCSIIFDEMALGTGVSYNQKKDQINGFVELKQRKNRFADHVLVFMLRGAIHKWQQPIAYFFCEGATSGAELKNILRDIVAAVTQTGLKPIILGCDQGSAFQSAIKSFQTDTKRDMLLQNEEPDENIIIGETKLHVIYDPSHLIKGIRNNFLNKDIVLNGKISKWSDIVEVYKTDCNHTESRILHKLNDQHVLPEKIKKMKVKNCVRVLSKTVAAALLYTSRFSHYVDGRPVSQTTRNTSEIVSFFDDLFDSINGASLNHKEIKGKALRSAVHGNSQHKEFWPEAIKTLEKLRFIDPNGHEKNVPTIKNFITTIKSYIKLWHDLSYIGVKVMRPRYFNTDPIENFFGQVRAYNYRNNDPTCQNFSNTFKALTITRVLNFHSNSFNCEDDPAEPLINIKSLFEYKETENVTESQTVQSGHLIKNVETSIVNAIEQARKERLNTHSKAYVTGWVLKKYFEKVNCVKCKKCLTASPSDTIHQWISNREFQNCKKIHKLSYPSEKCVRVFGTIQRVTNEYLENNAHTKKIKKNLNEIFSKYSFDIVDCSEHETFCVQYFKEVTIRFTIHNWCNIINKILRGVDVARINRKKLPHFQNLALCKYEKRYNKCVKKSC